MLFVEQFLVNDVANCLVFAANGGGEVDGIASEKGQVDEEVLAQLGLAKKVAIEEVLILALADVANQPRVQDLFIGTDYRPEGSGLGTSTCPP